MQFLSLRRHWVFLFLPLIYGLGDEKLTCKDFNGNPVEHGTQYMPDAVDRCKTCLCDRGFPTMCRLVSCSPPSCPFWEQVKTECCSFTCVDLPLSSTKTPNTNSTENTVTSTDSLTTLGLRLVASTVTSFLVLALLLFAVHQLRRKRLILAMRRYSDNRRRHNHDMYTPDYFGMTCPPYEEPPPPYSPPKPPEHPEEAPPPYDSVDSNHNVSSRVYPEPTLPHVREHVQSIDQSSTRSPPVPSREAVIQTIDRNIHARQLSRGSNSSWNTLPYFPGHNTRNQSRHLQRGLSENSDLESDRASTDFCITSDSELHYSRTDGQENSDLRHLRLAKLLSPSRSVNTTDTSEFSTPNSQGPRSRSCHDNLQNDDQYPDHNFCQSLNQSPSNQGNDPVTRPEDEINNSVLTHKLDNVVSESSIV